MTFQNGCKILASGGQKMKIFDFFQNHQKCYETCPQHQNNFIGMNFNGIGWLKPFKNQRIQKLVQ